MSRSDHASRAVKQTGQKPRRVGDGTPGPGRPKGSPNKNTVAVKQALEAAFEGMGGVPKLQEWAEGNPTEFYKLWIKMLPQDVKAEVVTATSEESATFKALPRATRDKIRAAMQAALESRGAGDGAN